MSRSRPSLLEPLSLFGAAVVGSATMWGRLWVTSPTTRGICGCGDPSLFQWFLAWPAHAMTTGRSLVFSRDLFAPHGVNLLANTSVLALGTFLAPLTWWRGPVLTENVALLLAAPVAVVTMDLLLRRVTTSGLVRAVCALVFGFSPYVLASLVVGHLMTAWIGVLPLICLGAVDSLSADRARAHRGQVLLCLALVAQFFLGTELLVLAAIAALATLCVLAITWAVSRSAARPTRTSVARLAWPLGIAAVLLGAPAAYALAGPARLTGKIWGSAFTPAANGTSLLELVRPASSPRAALAISGYLGRPPVNVQYLGWGLVGVVAIVTVWRWRDPVVRTASSVAVVCAVLALSPASVPWAPWRWLGTLPVLENVVQRRIVVFSLLACLVVAARGVGELLGHGRVGMVAALVALGVIVGASAVPEASALPFRTVAVSTPAWWRTAPHGGVVLSYPFPGNVIESPLTWQADAGFRVALVGGSGPQALALHQGADRRATEILDDLSWPLVRRVTLTAAVAATLRSFLHRDGVTEVVVPTRVRGGTLVAGGTAAASVAVFFTEVLGIAPRVVHRAWVFDVARHLGDTAVVGDVRARACTLAAAARPSSLGRCLGVVAAP